MSDGATYTFVTCRAGQIMSERKTGLMTVGCAAVGGLVVAARDEYNFSRLAVNEFHIRTKVLSQVILVI